METTAAQSVRTEKPVYHVALSFHPDEVDRAGSRIDEILADLRSDDADDDADPVS
jgi:hypothetical protein